MASQELRSVGRGAVQAIRFSIKLPARYHAREESGWGETVNIGSRGALLKDGARLRLGFVH
jgi:hypothetical protein